MPDAGAKPILSADAVDKIERANAANILKKVGAGKVLSRADREVLDKLQHPAGDDADKPPEFSVTHWSKHWCVTTRTGQRWRNDANSGHMPQMDDVPGILRWALGPGRKPPAFLRRCAQLRSVGSGSGYPPPAAGALDSNTHEELKQDWIAFTREHPAHRTRDQAAQIQTLERELDFASYALARARDRGDEAAQKKYSDELIKFSKAVKEQRLLADKLGLESGELLSKAEVMRIIHAHAFWTMRGTDVSMDALSRRLVNLAFPKDARAVLEPELLSVRFVAAYAQAVRTPAGNALPAWVAEAVRDAVDNFIENGAPLHDAAKAEP